MYSICFITETVHVSWVAEGFYWPSPYLRSDHSMADIIVTTAAAELVSERSAHLSLI